MDYLIPNPFMLKSHPDLGHMDQMQTFTFFYLNIFSYDENVHQNCGLQVGSIGKSIRSEGHIHRTQIHVLASMLLATSFG